MALEHDSAKGDHFLMNVEKDTINKNASETVPTTKPLLLQYTRRKRKTADDKTSSSMENSSSLSALPNRRCEVIFKYSRNRRKKTPSCVVSEHEEAMPTQNITLNPIPTKEVKIPDVCTLEQPRIRRVTKKLLILDVNGLLADIVSNVSVGYQANLVVSGKSVFKRPFCDDFLRFCFQKFDVGVWTSRTKRNMNPLLIFSLDSRHKLLFCWDQSHCTDTGFTTVENTSKPMFLKELKKIWEYLESTPHLNKGEYDESNTLLLDDSPYKALCNPVHTAIFPQSYRYRDGADSSLGPDGDIRLYLERLAEAENIQEYISQHPFGQRAITESDPSWFDSHADEASAMWKMGETGMSDEARIYSLNPHLCSLDYCIVAQTTVRSLGIYWQELVASNLNY
uniref:Mitochondrial import inner membrane translocase subunit TIM50 n=1 Tax=Salix viminalis TaxID=40686 RepID=A0A6N2L4Y5_SALVM